MKKKWSSGRGYDAITSPVLVLVCLATLFVCLACSGCGDPEVCFPEGPYLRLFDLLSNSPMTESGQAVRPGNRQGKLKPLQINEIMLPSLSSHPPANSNYTVDIRPGTRLRLHVALRPEAWDKSSDGVIFEVLVVTDFGRMKVLTFHLDPASNPDHRRWYPLLVDLDRFQGVGRKLILRTLPGPEGDPRYDWAVWGNPTLETTGQLVPLKDDKKTNIILISLDTLRKDHLESFGYPRTTTPHLSRLLRECVVFRDTQAPCHWTMPSHMSVLTSLHPDVHQVVDPEGRTRLPEGVQTLTSLLAKAGYRTGGLAACGFLKGDIGFSRGFEMFTLDTNDAERQNELAVEWLSAKRRRKAFVFLHYFDAHSDFDRSPYDAASGFDTLYPEATSVFSGCSPDGSLCASSYLLHLNKTRTALSRDELAGIETDYDRGLRYLDYQLATFMSRLKSLGMWENSLVVIFSDHGEEFQDHGRLLHAQLYQELLEVPFLIKLPGGSYGGLTVTEPVELLDLAPTILAVLGLPTPDVMQGRSLLPAIARAAGMHDWGEVGNGTTTAILSWSAEGRSTRIGRWKRLSWRDPVAKINRISLYNLEDDPAELKDLSGTVPDVEQWLHAQEREQLAYHTRLKKFIGPVEALDVDSSGFTDRERDRLKKLGYLE